ncbi:MAG: carbonic anhydrase [Bacteroidota bacterium]
MKRYQIVLVIICSFTIRTAAQEHQPIKPSELHQRISTQIAKSIQTMNEETKRDGADKKPRHETIYVSEKHGVVSNDHKETVETEEERSVVSNLLRLTEGNKRFVSGSLKRKDLSSQRAATANGQTPFAIVVTCSDSRVPPELIFDESIGQLFVIRLAGNVVDSLALGSIEYAVEHLHAHTLVILGHESCGAVKATIAGGTVPPNIGSIVRRIAPAVAKVREKKTEEKELLSECIKENVHGQIGLTMKMSPILFDAMVKGELLVLGGIYDLASGKVRFLTGE